MKNSLTEEEKDLLVLCLTKHNTNLLKKLNLLYSKQLDTRTVNEMREAVGDELAYGGFDKNNNWEPTEYGGN